MIKSLLDPSFSAYGQVEQFRRESNPALSHISVSGDTEVPIYCLPLATYWDYVEGMTILVIKEGNTLKQYYLDRMVTLYSGISFGFYSLGAKSAIMGDASTVCSQTQVALMNLANITPQMQQPNFFTLLRQVGHDGLFFCGEQHPPMELVYLEKGSLRNYCDGQELVLHPNEFLIFGPNQWHMQHSDEEVQFLTISFSWEGHDFSHLFNRVISASSEIQRSVHGLLREYEQELPGRDEFLNTQMKLLFLQILRIPEHAEIPKKPSPASEQAHRLIIDKAMQIVSERIYGKLSVSDLAAAVNVSNSQLTSLFRNYLGIAPAKYITHIRLEESKNLLWGKQLSVGEIADQLGYASIQHYSKQFRDWFGCAPSVYAQRENKQQALQNM